MPLRIAHCARGLRLSAYRSATKKRSKEMRFRSATPLRIVSIGFSRRAQYGSLVLEMESIQCPFCGQAFELAIDTSVASQRFTTDCEVCCRPFEVAAECET